MEKETGSLLQLFAMDKDGRMRSVDEVARGLACECVCPTCRDRVLARQGEIREWHFAHASGTDCERAAEGALHRAAKQVLLESGGMTVPPTRVVANATLPDGRTGTGEAFRPEMWVDFQSVETEQTTGAVRPDIVAGLGRTILFVEIAVTHFVDDNKKAALAELMVPTIEIDLAGFEREKWSWELLIDALVESATHKTWVHTLDRRALEREAHDAALRAAQAKPLSLPTASAAVAPRTRFWIGARMVDVIERPFGLAVWSPYDPGVNEQIKALMRRLGGRWQPRFKNWLAPLEARDYLYHELGKLSGQPPQIIK